MEQERLNLERLVETCGDRLLRLCTLYLGDMHLAEDAVQDAFLRALRSRERFRGDCAPETWLTRIAINVCKDYLRSPWRKRRVAAEALAGCTVPGPEPADDTLARAVMDLPPKYRSVVTLYYYQEWSTREIAKALGCSENAVRMRMSRARGMLKAKLEGAWRDEAYE